MNGPMIWQEGVSFYFSTLLSLPLCFKAHRILSIFFLFLIRNHALQKCGSQKRMEYEFVIPLSNILFAHMIFLAYTYDWSSCDLFVFLLVYVFEGISQLNICTYVNFQRKKSCILGILISQSCTHVILGSNIECTFQGPTQFIINSCS